MESCPTQAVLPLVGLAAEKVIRDRYISSNGATGKRRLPEANSGKEPHAPPLPSQSFVSLLAASPWRI
ncbi:MAG: hypothetical protein ACQESR_29545 [Planctomycetota bacterium]